MTMLSMPPRYPWAICHAVTKVFDVDDLKDLSDSCRHVLVALIKKVNQHYGQSPIYARRETIALEVGKSVETVYRALRELESKKFIEEREQQKNRYGKLTDSLIVLSQRLCVLLDLPTSPTVKSDRPFNQNKDFQYLHIHSSEGVDKAEQTPSHLATPKKKAIPEDLEVLKEQGLSLPAIYKLMGMATATGKRLSQIIAYVGKSINRYTGHGLYGFLVKLIQKNFDYAFLVRQREEQEKAKRDSVIQAKKKGALSNRTFADNNRDDVRFQVSAHTAHILLAHGSKWRFHSTMAIGDEFVEAVESGCYREVEAIAPDDWA